ncbi:MAG: PEGA domain-containing protein [Pseudomonadales bacterium]
MADDRDTIRPVSYTPRRQESPGPRRLSPLQMILALALIGVGLTLWFMFTAKSVRIELDPGNAQADVGGLSFALGDVWLLREGRYPLHAQAPGYYPLQTEFEVGPGRNQTHQFTLTPLPGRVTFESTPPGATVTINGKVLGTTPTQPLDVEAGSKEVGFTLDRYQPLTLTAEITGRQQAQTVAATLRPDWADVSVSSVPTGAEIFIDDAPTGARTPAVVQIPSGEHELRLKAAGHKSYRQRLLVAAEEQRTLPEVTLERADSVLVIETQPAGAGITLNGRFQGQSPVELAVRSGVSYRVQAFADGYEPGERSVSLSAGAEQTLRIALERLTGTLVVRSQPEDAELLVDGAPRGAANQSLTLPVGTHRVEIRKAGYAGYSTQITPRDGLTQELKVRLLTLEEARLAALKPLVTTSQGQELVLLQPGPFTMGASRRQPGRRANETLHEVTLRRLFYLGTREVTNAEFRAFASGHDSGKFQDYSLNDDDQPVVNLSWTDAALYCNWLSDQDGLPRFYDTEFGKVTGINPRATGYRLPTEAEWAWSARQVDVSSDGEPLRFPWGGNLPPPDRHGNYADRSAVNLVGRIIFGYNDNYIVAAPVATYPPTSKGLYDLSGNVAEWVNDFYEIPSTDAVTDPLGPAQGEYHVIRGSSWMHGTITELRLAFRDYGSDGRQDVGFRIARFAEAD